MVDICLKDIWRELIFLSVDCCIIAACLEKYKFYRNTIRKILKAEKFGVNPEPESLNKGNEVVIVNGVVTALSDKTLRAINAPQAEGVIRRITILDHVSRMYPTGIKLSDSKQMDSKISSVPFGLKNGDYIIEVSGATDSDILDLKTVSASFQTRECNSFEALRNWLFCEREQGVTITEDLLQQGTTLNGIGKLTVVNGMKTLCAPPNEECGYILTTMPINCLIRHLNREQRVMKYILLATGTIGMICVGMMMRKFYKFYLKKLNAYLISQRLNELRTQRSQSPDPGTPIQNPCVICLISICEIMLLPCGHFCICGDCNVYVTDLCPICRTEIQEKIVPLR